MSKQCTPLWRGAPHARTTFEGSDVVFVWQAQGIVHPVISEQNVKVLQQFQLQPPVHYTTLHCTTRSTPLHCTTFKHTTLQLQLQLQLHYNYTTPTIQLHYTTLHSLQPHINYNYNYNYNYTALHYPLHSIPSHSTTLHYNYNYNYQ